MPFFINIKRFVGQIQLRQVRQESNSCKVSKAYRDKIPFCYNTHIIESKKSFGNNSVMYDNNLFLTIFKKRFEYQDTDEYSFRTNLDYEVPSGGFIELLDTTSSNASAKISFLKVWLFFIVILKFSFKDNDWIDINTRIIMITVNLFNGNLNRFAVVRLVFERMPATGNFVAYSKIFDFRVPYYGFINY